MRRSALVAVLIVIASTALLYQTNVRVNRPPSFGRGGAFAGSLTDPGASEKEDLSIESPVPKSVLTRSSAVLSAPTTPKPGSGISASGAERFPAFGSYIYTVDGYEQATAFGSRDYPNEMTMTVHRTQPSDPNVPQLRDDEVIYDLDFSQNHEEREIVAFRENGIVFTYEAGSVSFGFTRTSEATYDPPMLQIPVPLVEGARQTGKSEAKDSNGDTTRVEDWTVSVLGQETIEIMDQQVPTWVVQIDRQSEPGGSEQVTRSRKYWFDPARKLWVRWEEHFTGAQDFGPGTFNYKTEFTATLTRFEHP